MDCRLMIVDCGMGNESAWRRAQSVKEKNAMRYLPCAMRSEAPFTDGQ